MVRARPLVTGLATVLLLGPCGASAAQADDTPPPWTGREHRAWFRSAAERAFHFDAEPDLRKVPELFLEPLPSSFSVHRLEDSLSAELHVVGAYSQPPPIIAEDGRVTIVPIEVAVRQTAKPVVLVLVSFESVVWQVTVTPGAHLAAVHHRCFKRCLVRVEPDAIEPQPLPSPLVQTDAYREVDAHSYVAPSHPDEADRALRAIGETLALPIASDQRNGDPWRFSVPLVRDDDVLAKTLRVHANLLHNRSASAVGPYVLIKHLELVVAGRSPNEPQAVVRPKDLVHAATPADDNSYYGVGFDGSRPEPGTVLMQLDSTGAVIDRRRPPEGMPKLDSLRGIAYDSRRRRVLLASHFSSQPHYVYVPSTDVWEAVPAERTGGGLAAVTYSATNDTLYGLQTDDSGARLLILDPELSVRSTIRLEPAWVVGRRDISVQLAAARDSLVLCRIRSGELGRPDERCFVLRPPSGDLKLLKGAGHR